MSIPYEQKRLLKVMHGMCEHLPANSSLANAILEWVMENDVLPGWKPQTQSNRSRGVAVGTWRSFRRFLASELNDAERIHPDLLEDNISAVSNHIKLTSDEREIFGLVVRAAAGGLIKSFFSIFSEKGSLQAEDIIGHLTGIPAGRIRRALAPSARLMSSGLLEFNKHSSSSFKLQPVDRISSALEPPSNGLQDILSRLFAPLGHSDLTWDDFSHLGATGDFIFRLLQGSLSGGEKGVNILLHGAPGTGKTEFCKVLAQRLNAHLYSVGEADDDGDEPSRFDRFQHLRLAQRLFAKQGSTLVLFDEMEDVLPGADGTLFGHAFATNGSKVHMNRILESNCVPTLWTSNNIDGVDPAFLRRFTYIAELRTPPVAVRARVWSKRASHHGINLAGDVCMELAQSIPDAPAFANTAIQAARIAGGGETDVRHAAAAISRAVNGGQHKSGHHNSSLFNPELANADHDLDLITERFVSIGAENTGGLCLSGPPGTGKSAFARFLADRMQMPVLERRASDLLDRYVGGSERNIANAFTEARDTQAFLVFDEADSLLGSRDGASHRWEISQVNEMLTWMENHPLPFACTTNLVEQLDHATARRFTLKIRFRPLSFEQREACFRRFFNIDPPAGLQFLNQLTPGDFAVVAKRSNLLGIKEAEAIVSELRREQAAKPQQQNPIGFRAAS